MHYLKTYLVLQAVLLSAEQNMKAREIARIVRKDERTVQRWLKSYQQQGIAGLPDAPPIHYGITQIFGIQIRQILNPFSIAKDLIQKVNEQFFIKLCSKQFLESEVSKGINISFFAIHSSKILRLGCSLSQLTKCLAVENLWILWPTSEIKVAVIVKTSPDSRGILDAFFKA